MGKPYIKGRSVLVPVYVHAVLLFHLMSIGTMLKFKGKLTQLCPRAYLICHTPFGSEYTGAMG